MISAGTGRKWNADALANELNLDDKTRTRLKIRTIDAVDFKKQKRTRRRRLKRKIACRVARARTGATPHSVSNEARQPWIAEGINRATWYRRRAKNRADATDSRPIVRSTYAGFEPVATRAMPRRQAPSARPAFAATPRAVSGNDQVCPQATAAFVVGLAFVPPTARLELSRGHFR
jgi:hypothetical protein